MRIMAESADNTSNDSNLKGDLLTLPDGEGTPITLVNYGNVHGLPGIPGIAARMVNLVNLNVRSEDIWICASMKCGTHWAFEILSMLINNTIDIENEPKENLFAEFVSIEQLSKRKSPRLINTHFPAERLPKAALEKCKIIYMLRNPKDAMVSTYYHVTGLKSRNYSGTWNGFFGFLMEERPDDVYDYNSWFCHTASWMKELERNPNILMVKYEDLKKNPVQEIERMANFVGFERDNSFYEKVRVACSFDAMKARKTSPFECPQEGKNDVPWKPGVQGMYRKGQIGDWKNYFTVAQNERFDAKYNEFRKRHNIDIQLDFEQ